MFTYGFIDEAKRKLGAEGLRDTFMQIRGSGMKTWLHPVLLKLSPIGLNGSADISRVLQQCLSLFETNASETTNTSH
jgi:hypothetical protein